MNKKLLSLIGGSVLSAMLLAGCNVDDQDAPPEDNNDIVDPDVNDNNGVLDNDNDVLDNDNGVLDNDDDDNDVNTDNDLDPAKDDNTPGEEPLEDTRDVNDKDNVDE